MKHLEKKCLTCKFFRPQNVQEGVCRVNKDKYPDYPIMKFDDLCDSWATAGQQYYIRAGWVKNQLEKDGTSH